MSEIDPFDELLQSTTQDGDEPVQGTESERETLYNFAFIDEDSKREVRRRLLKAVALPGHLVPFASRDLPIARGWGTGGLQVTLALWSRAMSSRLSTRATMIASMPLTCAA
jgi:Phosphonate metabolism protein PhnJ